MNKLKSLLKGKPYLENWGDIKDLPFEERRVGVSDFMLANGGWASKSCETPAGTPTCWSFLASRYSASTVYSIDFDGDSINSIPNYTGSGVAPALRFNLPFHLSENYNPKAVFGCEVSIGEEKYKDDDGRTCSYHTITFANTRGYGEKADKKLSKTLEKALADGKLEKVDRQIAGRMNGDKIFKKFDVYQYQGKEYAYVEAKKYDGGRKAYIDGTPIKNGEMVFIELKPATLIIRTPWEELPKYINPNGTGKATELVVRVQNAVNGGVPFGMGGSVEYISDNCDIGHYVEEEFIQEFFIDDENEATSTYNTHLEEEQQ